VYLLADQELSRPASTKDRMEGRVSMPIRDLEDVDEHQSPPAETSNPGRSLQENEGSGVDYHDQHQSLLTLSLYRSPRLFQDCDHRMCAEDLKGGGFEQLMTAEMLIMS
jgi:hypothetical protein